MILPFIHRILFPIRGLTTALILILFLVSAATAQNYVTPQYVTTLSPDVDETSGLVNLDGEIWTHNDSGGQAEIYQIDLFNGDIIRTVQVTNADNVDWEDITMNDEYVYIGDVGNNDGSRTDLRIYRISRADLADNDEVAAGHINFAYSDQTSFEPEYHNTNYDCEAIIHYQDQLCLFTKNWVDLKTHCYVLPETTGTHEAILQSEFNVNCLISGAAMIPTKDALALIGYTTSGVSYTWLFEGVGEDDFFSGENTKLVWTLLSQIEGVCDAGQAGLYFSSEEFSGILDPTLYYLDAAGFLTGYNEVNPNDYRLYSYGNTLYISSANGEPLSGTIRIFNPAGNQITALQIKRHSNAQIPISCTPGIYILVVETNGKIWLDKLFIR